MITDWMRRISVSQPPPLHYGPVLGGCVLRIIFSAEEASECDGAHLTRRGKRIELILHVLLCFLVVMLRHMCNFAYFVSWSLSLL